MRVSKLTLGVLVSLLALGLGVNALQLPNPSGRAFGPATFPLVIAALMVVTGVVLLVEGWRRRAEEPLVAFAAWTRKPKAVLRFALVPASIALYIVFVGPLGFVPVTVLMLFILFMSLGVPPLSGIAVSIAVALGVHSLFYLGLGVQLPWGLLAPIRW